MTVTLILGTIPYPADALIAAPESASRLHPGRSANNFNVVVSNILKCQSIQTVR